MKPKELNNINYKRMSFLFIKILLRAISIGLKPVFIDESKFTLKNENFKTWVKMNDFCHYGIKKIEKRNIILAVGVEKFFYYHITNKNTNTNIFKKFMIELINKIQNISDYIFIMDNLRVHLSKEIKELVKLYKIKIIYTVPYESSFNPIELSFRFIKNKIYRHIYSNIKELQDDVEKIINTKEFEVSLKKNFVETLEKYQIYINNNININLNDK